MGEKNKRNRINQIERDVLPRLIFLGAVDAFEYKANGIHKKNVLERFPCVSKGEMQSVDHAASLAAHGCSSPSGKHGYTCRMPTSTLLHGRQASQALLVAALVTLALYWVPYLNLLSWPLLLLSTLVHELGHGITAMLLGGRFETMTMWPDGSGVAAHRGNFGALSRALISAGGLLGPPLAALALFLAGRRSRSAHIALGLFALFLVVVTVLWASGAFTVMFCVTLAIALGLLAWKASPALSQIVCVFLAVQMSLSAFSRSDYLFTATARTGAGLMPSDVGQIANALWLPYWLWGGLIAALSLALLALGAWRFARTLG